jgi:hypothetical protein
MRRIISEKLAQPFYDGRSGCSDDGLIQLPIDRVKSYDIAVNTSKYKTDDILTEIFITSLSHTLAFGGIPNQEKVNSILNLLKTPEIIEVFLTPIKQLCMDLTNEKKKILLNPCLGYKIPLLDNKGIPSDCDLIIDDILYDIKCTIGDKSVYEILQLLGYASLINCNPFYGIKINNISIINLLQGQINNYDISFITLEQMISYLKILI